jgi:hypothetical protein
MHGEEDELVELVEALHDPPSRGCVTFASRWIVATTYVRGSCGTGNLVRASGAKIRLASAITSPTT